MADFLRGTKEVLRVCQEAQHYCVLVNQTAAAVCGGVSPYPLAGGAMFSLTAEVAAIHRAVLCLCENGWAFTCGPLLRTMLDLLLNAAVITAAPAEAEYRGFKYTHFFLKMRMNDPAISAEERRRVRKQIEDGLKRLPPSDLQKARDFMFRNRMWGYWYCPEYKNPTDALTKLFSARIRKLYDTYSGGGSWWISRATALEGRTGPSSSQSSAG